MPCVRVRRGVSPVSRRIHRAELAVTTSGAVLLNVVTIDGTLGLAELLKLAVSQRGEVFVGVVLAPSEVRRLIRDVGFVLPNVTMPLVGARLGRNK